MPIQEVDQVGFVVRSLETALERYRRLVGVGPFEVVESEQLRSTEMVLRGKPAFWKARAAFARLGSLTLELIEPVEGESLWHEYVEVRGDGVHHLGCLADDLEEEIARFASLGAVVLQRATNVGRSRWAYLDTERVLGIVLELREPWSTGK